jgi:8-oxo-dGTP pyrophosphatase MutT (NUDIX family)
LITQYGALPYRIDREKGLQVLLITSRDTGRWVIPKGNPVAGLAAAEAAAQEAYEEAGIEGEVAPDPIGGFDYGKRRRDGSTVPARVTVYALRVERQHSDWPERGQRRLGWFAPAAAAQAVQEPELKALILAFTP